MAYKLIDQTYRPYVNAPLCEFICDTDADIESLPKCCTGSKALSVATGITHMVNASGYWVPLGGGIVGGSLEGDGQEFHQFAPTTLAFRSTEPLEEFQEVKVNDETVDPENYDLEEGSTIVKFKPDYLKTLGNGKHKVAIVSKNNVVSGNFNVKVPELNEYGFYYNQPYSAVVDYFGGTSVFFFREGGTMDFILVENNYTEVCTYSIENGNLTVNSASGTFTGLATADGIYCNELYTTFALGDTSVVADEDYIYTYKEDLGGYEVTAIDKTKAEYGAIKTGINGIDTVAIRDEAFRGCSNFTDIVIPDSVTIIGFHAFNSCTNLTSVTIPSGVTTISDGAFYGCSSIKNITIPEGVTTINQNTFKNCSSLATITIPNGVTSIGNNAFENCTSLISATIPESVTKINFLAFYGCSSLTNVTIPNGVTSIGWGAFEYCSSLGSVVIGNGVTMLDDTMFYGCSNLTSITFNGTTTQWNAITKSNNWNLNVPATHVQCTDGTVAL